MSAQILVVEKNEKIGGRICAQLREKGHEVRDCRNGPDVVLELRKNGVDVILLDNAIPMGAVKTARILRLHERYNHIPIGLPPEKERARVVIKEGGERDRPFPAEAVHAHRVAEEADRSPGERRNGREANEPGSTGPGESENISILKAEYELLGITHADCGGELAIHWDLPGEVRTAITSHHQPGQSTQHRRLAAMMHISDIAVRTMGIGYGGDPLIPQTDPYAARLQKSVEEIVQNKDDFIQQCDSILGA